MKRLLLAFLFTCSGIVLHAQLLTWTPPFPREDDATQTLVITFDASKGNKGLLAHTPTSDVYIHTGVITNLSTSSTDWRYVKLNQNFNQPNPALQATYIGNNQWQFTIMGNLKSYYGVPAGESIQKIALLFRSGNGAKKGTNTDGSDMYIPIYTTALAVRFTQPFTEPAFVPTPERLDKNVGETFGVSAVANKPALLSLSLNGNVIQTATNATSITANPVITTAGTQTVVVEATEGGITKRDTLRFFAAGTVTTVPLPAGVQQGINIEAGNTAVTLVLYAPFKNRVSVIGEFAGSNWTEQPVYQMNKTPDGAYWWLRITGLTPGTEYGYQYLVDGTLRIADPYTEKVLDPYNNNDQGIPAAVYPALKPYPSGKTTGHVSVLQTAAPVYNWSVSNFNRPDKRGLVIYELLLRDFVAAHDWNTLKDTIGYLKRLGINAIELLPFNEFEGNNSWGYNPSFYFAPDKYYGTKNKLKEFIDTCHKNGIAVIMDIALNHQFGLSPMVQLYYDAANNRPAANNPWFNPVARHPFNVGFDMNHESLDTRYYSSRVVAHWLQEYKIDGFRFDLSKGFTQVNSGSDVGAWSRYDASRVAIWKRYYDTVQTKAAGAYVILEHFADNTEEKELSDYGMMLWGNANEAYTEAAMGYLEKSDFSYGIHTIRGWANPHLITYMESHDEERMLYKNVTFGKVAGSYSTKDTTTALQRAAQAAAFFFTIPGPKMIWQFGELGYDYSITSCHPSNVIPQPYPKDDCRVDPKPIRWDYKNDPRRQALYNTYSKLIQLRFHPLYKASFINGRLEQSLSSGFKWLKVSTDTSNLIVIGNFDVTARAGVVTFQSAGTWYDYLNNTIFEATGAAQTINLQPGEFRVYVNRNIANLTTTSIFNTPTNANDFKARLYPNPVSSSTKIEFTLPESGKIEINLLNAVGQHIKTLQQSFLAKGEHSYIFNRSNLSRGAGVYYLLIKTKTHTKTFRIIL